MEASRPTAPLKPGDDLSRNTRDHARLVLQGVQSRHGPLELANNIISPRRYLLHGKFFK